LSNGKKVLENIQHKEQHPDPEKRGWVTKRTGPWNSEGNKGPVGYTGGVRKGGRPVSVFKTKRLGGGPALKKKSVGQTYITTGKQPAKLTNVITGTSTKKEKNREGCAVRTYHGLSGKTGAWRNTIP